MKGFFASITLLPLDFLELFHYALNLSGLSKN